MIDERIKFRHPQCFLAVARHGSLQKASDVLAITAPAVIEDAHELKPCCRSPLRAAAR
jgi:LysR family pca operon transcriptional activator